MRVEAGADRPVILFLSNVPWDPAGDRPSQLMARASTTFEVVFWEPAVASQADDQPALRMRRVDNDMLVATPVLPAEFRPLEIIAWQRKSLDGLLHLLQLKVKVAYYLTPSALEFSAHLPVSVTIYETMDKHPSCGPADLGRMPLLERRLLRRADLVIRNGRILFNAKRAGRGGTTHLSTNAKYEALRTARNANRSPTWQGLLPRPRVGYFGPVDPRLDLKLLEAVTSLRPAWHFIMIGEIAGIDRCILPRGPNIHWRGPVAPELLPSYLSGWDAGLLPLAPGRTPDAFARAKPLEFLAAGVPVVTTPPQNQRRGARDLLVPTRREPEGIVAALQEAIEARDASWLASVDARLSAAHWDADWSVLHSGIERVLTPERTETAGAGRA